MANIVQGTRTPVRVTYKPKIVKQYAPPLGASIALVPDAILSKQGLQGTVTAIQDDPDAPDASWLTTV